MHVSHQNLAALFVSPCGFNCLVLLRLLFMLQQSKYS